MGTTTDSSEAGLRRVAGVAFDAALGRTNWDAPLDELVRLMSAQSATMVLYNTEKRAAVLPVFHDVSESVARDYSDYFWARDVWRNAAIARAWPKCVAATTETFMRDDEFLHSEFYNDFLRGQGIRHWCGGGLTGDAMIGSGIGLMRDTKTGAFEDDEIESLQIAMGFLGRAIEIHTRLMELQSGWASLIEGLEQAGDGVMVLDVRGRLLDANRVAASALKSGVFFFNGDGLRTRDSRADLALKHEMRRALDPDLPTAPKPVLVPQGSDRLPLFVRVLPVAATGSFSLLGRAALIVLIGEPGPRHGAPVHYATTRYGLTPAEARLLGQLVDGHSLKEASEVFGVSLHTVRNQLKQIFSKTDTARQAQLVSLVLRMRGAHDPQ